MNSDFRIAVSLPTHPKALKLMRRCGDVAFYNLVRFWSFVAQNKPTGDLGDMDLEDIEIASGWNGQCSEYAQALLELRFIEKTEFGYRVHDWHRHNGYACHAEIRSEKARKAAESRWTRRNNATSNAQAMLQASPSNAQAASPSNAPAPAPSPVPTPNPDPSPNPNNIVKGNGSPGWLEGACKEVIGRLNEMTGKEFKWQNPTYQRQIFDLVEGGHTLDDIKCVVEHKTNEWLGKTASDGRKMDQFLRPSTLFGPKFEEYLNEIPFAD
jgi:uncharacterized phage protein (TIGR02220 family)